MSYNFFYIKAKKLKSNHIILKKKLKKKFNDKKEDEIYKAFLLSKK